MSWYQQNLISILQGKWTALLFAPRKHHFATSSQVYQEISLWLESTAANYILDLDWCYLFRYFCLGFFFKCFFSLSLLTLQLERLFLDLRWSFCAFFLCCGPTRETEPTDVRSRVAFFPSCSHFCFSHPHSHTDRILTEMQMHLTHHVWTL